MSAVIQCRRENKRRGEEQVKVNITMSLDGFVAGPDQSEKDPLGIGGESRPGRDSGGC